MRNFARAPHSLGWLAVVGAAVVCACGSNPEVVSRPGSGGNGGAGGSSNSVTLSMGGNHSGSGGNGSGDSMGLSISPGSAQAVTIETGAPPPTVTFTASYRGVAVNAGWSVDRGEIGTIAPGPSSQGVFIPSGNQAGVVTITASLLAGGQTYVVKRQVTVTIHATQNGATSSILQQNQIAPTDKSKLNLGGGVGGVGGEGLGPALADAGTVTALGAAADDGSALGLKFVYPYDKTVWPRGLPAPLLMWDWATGDADGIQIKLSNASKTFSWTGTFGRPAILGAAGAFVRHPIPQDVWVQATNSAGGLLPDNSADTLTVEFTVAKAGVAHGPAKQTWVVAPTRLSGTIYYQSYGTWLANNYSSNGVSFGAAVLSIRAGDPGPALVSSAKTCQVCHSVASGGSRLAVQNEPNNRSTFSVYDLSPAGAIQRGTVTQREYPALFPDGSKALVASGALLSLPTGVAAAPAITGLSTVTTAIAAPTFSPDGKRVAFVPAADTSFASHAQKLVVMDFDPAKNIFSNPALVADYADAASTDVRPGWPAFFPDGQAVVFEKQVQAGNEGVTIGALNTRRGAKGQIAWTSVADATHVTALNQLNGRYASGTSYLPTLKANTLVCKADSTQVGGMDPLHDDDANLNYEPTVNPIASGGFAWVVFTSRRMYGNEATIPPFCSDPRGVDLTKNITTKKLWVAAIDLNAKPGTDGSHPAFYLPGQELLAGNARGFWVLDPCKSDGMSCESGDQCCNGFCEPGGDAGALVCSNTTVTGTCSQTLEKCTTTADCCDPVQNSCVGGFCVQSVPPVPY